jgi:biopolymer transport protein ExbB/TolQ
MPDWTWLASINVWQVAIVIVAIYVVIRLLVRFWPWLRKVMDYTAALGQLPDFITRTDNTLAAQNLALVEQNKKIAEIHHETHRNDGSSIKDAVARSEEAIERVELGVKGLYERADKADAADAAMRRELEDTRPHPPARRRQPNNKEKK